MVTPIDTEISNSTSAADPAGPIEVSAINTQTHEDAISKALRVIESLTVSRSQEESLSQALRAIEALRADVADRDFKIAKLEADVQIKDEKIASLDKNKEGISELGKSIAASDSAENKSGKIQTVITDNTRPGFLGFSARAVTELMADITKDGNYKVVDVSKRGDLVMNKTSLTFPSLVDGLYGNGLVDCFAVWLDSCRLWPGNVFYGMKDEN
ncbi:hypothetical protein DL98DRAFT_593860 [Cadophora sp. DSE1049]|nr:hypothetical protein DL98DRAFT_593860 [Cadophora sp. DSE1049]